MDYRAVKVQLERDESPLEPPLANAVCEFRGQLPIDKELEMVASRANARMSAVVPISLPEIFDPDRVFDPLVKAVACLVDDQANSALARKRRPCCEVEVPRAKDRRANSDMAEVVAVALERTLPCRVHSRPEFYAGISVGQHPAAEPEVEVSQVLVGGIHQTGKALL